MKTMTSAEIGADREKLGLGAKPAAQGAEVTPASG
jgi:hypothetical protein